MDDNVIGSVDAAEYALALEKKAFGSNYGFPRDIVMFPERKKLIRTGKLLKGGRPTINSILGDVVFKDMRYISTESVVNLHFGLKRTKRSGQCWGLCLDRNALCVREDGIQKYVDLPESVIDEDTIYEHNVKARHETQMINFGRLTSGIAVDWVDKRQLSTAFSEFAVEKPFCGTRMLVTRSHEECHYDAVDVFGHCAVGATLFDEDTYNVYWHVGTKRFYVGQYAGEISAITMLSWRVCVIEDEFCYIGER